MKRSLLVLGLVSLIGPPLHATGDDPCRLYVSKTDGDTEQGWFVQAPAGPSDYFNVRIDAPIDFPASRLLGNAVLLSGMSIGVADFGASTSYPIVGCYRPNTALDSSGFTPDLSAPVAQVFSPPILGGPIGDRCLVDFGPAAALPSGTYHSVVQFPPGDPGLLGVHADSDTDGKGGWPTDGLGPGPESNDSSGFTTDGYATVANLFNLAEFALDLVVDHERSTSFLSLGYSSGDMTGDFTTLTIIQGDPFSVNIHMPPWNGGVTSWQLFVCFGGIPFAPAGGILPALPCPRGWNSLRVNTTWPRGFGNLTLCFTAFTGQAGTPGSLQQSNVITIYSLPDPNIEWGVLDDGSIESAWVVQFPAGSSDYFSANYGPCPGQGYGIYSLAALDFGSSVSSYPSSGLAPSNTIVDPGGNTPDLANAYENATLPFPPLTFATTSGQYVTRVMTNTGPVGSGNAHGYVQFPPGDNGLIGVGADSNNSFIGVMTWTLDGFATPANIFGAGNWGMRVQ